MKRLGFLLNPIAGMGGRVGLKGTDRVVEEARARGAEPVSPKRAHDALAPFAKTPQAARVEWVTCGPPMGEAVLREVGLPTEVLEIVFHPPEKTTQAHTVAAARAFRDAGVDLFLFCGGDGTARDVLDAVGDEVPVLGIPAGVKMHSAVFAVDPEAVSPLLTRFVDDELRTGKAEVLDLDEDRYRQGEWNIRLYGVARTPQEPNLVQVGKMMVAEASDEALLEEMAEYLRELMAENPEAVFLFGPGGTTTSLCEMLALPHTLLGIDAYREGERIGEDLNEEGLLVLLEEHPDARAVLSPIGAQGFILGRGNLQFSPTVLRKVGLNHLLVVATPAKLRATPTLRVDSGDPEIDEALAAREYLRVIVGYRTMKLHPIERAVNADPDGPEGT